MRIVPKGSPTLLLVLLSVACNLEPDHYCPPSCANSTHVWLTFDVADNQACGVGPDGLSCAESNWHTHLEGAEDYGNHLPPFIDVGLYTLCGIDTAGQITCFGPDDHGQNEPPAGAFTQVDVGHFHACGKQEDGVVQCWGRNEHGQCDVPADTAFSDLAAGVNHTCGLTDDGRVLCWGCSDGVEGLDYMVGQCDAPTGTFVAIESSDFYACALDAEGAASCWGCESNVLDCRFATDPAPGPFVDLGLGPAKACGLTEQGHLECWGATEQHCGPPNEPLLEIEIGQSIDCGRVNQGRVECWGDLTYELDDC